VPGLVFFLHGLGGDEHSWQAVPDFLSDALGPDFEVATPGYSATIGSRADMEISARQLLTLLQVTYSQHKPIYLIGHSMGGLIAREMCRQLLTDGPDELLNKIPAALTAGTPLEGARHGNAFLRLLPFLSPKIHQLCNPRATFADYRVAIRQAKQREPKVTRPMQLHIQMEDDGVIARHTRANFTEDDHEAGVVRGTHRDFADTNERAKYVADVLLTALRKSQNAVSAPNIVETPAAAAGALPDRLLVIACSRTKRDGGGALGEAQIARWVPQEGLRQRMISRRNYIYTILKEMKLADGVERGGNRADQPANLSLLHGKDLGGVSADGQYLPAWQRYNGRMYARITEAGWEPYFQNAQTFRVLIMSGLYGLVEPEEPLQNYDVHLTDTHTGSGVNVRSMWLELYTELLDAYVRNAYRNRKVKIFNFLCDKNYVDAVQWHSLPREQCSVYHFASPNVEDVELLPPAGTVVRAIFADPARLEGFEREDVGTRYPITDFGVAPANAADMQFVFESRVGITKQ
jgi:pimeloyl-ACP methyl ester carboxylesterase